MSLDAFQPQVREWFATSLGTPTPPQVEGWPAIQRGDHTLIAAPTGSGKTLAAFLSAIDDLFAQGEALADETRVLYVSPLRALSNDVQRNLTGPLAAIRASNEALPEVRVSVRTGDTPAGDRAKMLRRPPHILVTTPESLYILLTSKGGRRLLSTVKIAIVDEIHALIGSKRGAHLALSLERLEALTGGFQRIGLSATQKPLSTVGQFLVGVGRSCTLVDVGHLREIDLAVEIPGSPLEVVCSHDTWDEIYQRMARLIEAHRTTLIFANTRKLTERLAARLSDLLGEDAVTSHHGSLSRERRLDAERRLKNGELKALVATSSLELGIDIGDVDLVIQAGVTSSLAALLQRVGRAGHCLGKIPKGRIFPLTLDELVASAALLTGVQRGRLDVTPQPVAPLDVLAQQTVASALFEDLHEDELLTRWRRAWPYRDLDAETLLQVIGLHTEGRSALLHRDGVGRRIMGTKRAPLAAVTSGGTIPDKGEYRVVAAPDGVMVGSLDEDFAIDSSVGDIIQLGNTAWRVLKVETGTVHVADAGGAPASLPFWLGEGPARTKELSEEVASVRERSFADDDAAFRNESGERGRFHFPDGAAWQIAEAVREGARVLGAIPTQECVVIERFFDESGGMQLVVHAPFGGRINRAFGLALRKRFCKGFGFELQAAANEEAFLLSLGPHHSFPLEEVFDYLHPNTVRLVLTQAILAAPMFASRWRWNVVTSLCLPRFQGGRKVPTALMRMKAEDLLARAFPEALACGETLPSGDLPVPLEHPLVRQTVEDCLTEAMDIDGLIDVLTKLRDGRIRKVAIDTAEPSRFAHGILNSQPYTFLDDAPLEERRARAVVTRRGLDPHTVEALGNLDQRAVARVREEVWPRPDNLEEVHEALLWMGYVREDEAPEWALWLAGLLAAGRVQKEGDRWYATEASRDPATVVAGRLEALGPVVLPEDGGSHQIAIASDEAEALLEVERSGRALRTLVQGRTAWCDRRLLARIHRYTVEGLRERSRPVPVTTYLRFLAGWQHRTEATWVEGPAGVLEVVRQLAGFAVPAGKWERDILAARCRNYRREWLDQITLAGDVVWGRLFGASDTALKTTPLCLVPREDLDGWLALGDVVTEDDGMSPDAAAVLTLLRRRGALFAADLMRGLDGVDIDAGLSQLIGRGLVTADSFDGLRQLLAPRSRRKLTRLVGRWAPFRTVGESLPFPPIEFLVRQLLQRYGVLFRRVLMRERIALPWRDMVRELRLMELRGEVYGGRFVAGLSGEQFALPLAVRALRDTEAAGELDLTVAAADPLNLEGILTTAPRVPTGATQRVAIA